MSSSVWGVCGCVLFAWLALSSPAEGQVELSLRDCDALDEGRVRELLDVELVAESFDADDKVEVRVSCQGGVADAFVEGSLNACGETHSIPLGDTPERLLALQLAEDIRLGWCPPEPPPRGAARRFTLAFGAVWFRERWRGWGGGLALSRDVARYLGWELDAQAMSGSEPNEFGSTRIRIASVGAAIRAFWDIGAFRLAGSLGLRLGSAFLEGRTSDAAIATGRVRGFWGGPRLALTPAVFLSEHVSLSASAEGGVALFRVEGRVGERVVFRQDRLWLSVALRLGWVFVA
ncbi:MAG: hypothetical protein AAF645_06155 [Myxococcota bacterium]